MPASEGWIDVSVPIRSGMPTWPDDPRVWVQRTSSIEEGAPANVSVVSMPTHAGTHLDAPLHFLEDGASIDRMPAEVGLGPAHVVDVDTLDPIGPEAIERVPGGTERVLFKTDNSMRCWQVDDFVEEYVYLSTRAAEALADRGVRLVGIDYLSVGGIHDNIEPVHRTLLEAGVWLLEGLDLSEAPSGSVELACLPMRVEDGDGAPARAFVRAREG